MAVIQAAPGTETPGRSLALHLPAFRLERCGYQADQVAALITEQKSAMRLVALTPAASAAGLRKGMTASQARALSPQLELEELDESGEDFDRQALLQALSRYSDRVFPLSSEDFVLGVECTAQLFGGEPALLAEVQHWLEEAGHVCQAAITEDPLAAVALACWGSGDVVVAPGRAAEALAPLPVDCLRPSSDLSRALATLGIEVVGQWARLDAASVAGRFGHEGVRLHRIARGLLAGGLEPPGWREVEPIVAQAVLAEATPLLEPISFLLPGLLRQIAGQLLRRDLSASRLALRFVLEGRPARTVRIRVGRPTRNPDLLLRILRARLHDLRLDAPVSELQIEVEETAGLVTWQLGLVDRTEAPEPLQDLLARLIDALGEQALFSARAAEDWCPERAWRAVPIDPGRARPLGLRPPTLPPRPRQKVDPVDALEVWERTVPRPRPSVLLDPPQPVQVGLEEGRPMSVRLQDLASERGGADSGWRRVLAAQGPERLRGAWWSPSQRFDRTYWVVRLPQGSGWIFQERGRWFWHGWFD